MKKSYKAFLNRAEEYEKKEKIKEALDDYRTVKKFCNNSFVQEKIDELSNKIKSTKNKKMKLSCGEVLDILNSGNFIDIKKLANIGDKRAQSIVDFILSGNFFESLDDLKLLFSEKIVRSILSSCE